MYDYFKNISFIKIYKLVIVNYSIFFLLSTFIYFNDFPINIELIPNLFLILTSSALLTIFSISNYRISPIFWFIVSSTIWVGIGSITSVYKFNIARFDDLMLDRMSGLSEVNLLNSTTFLIITLTSFICSKKHIKLDLNQIKDDLINKFNNKLTFLFLILFILLIPIKIVFLEIFVSGHYLTSILSKLEYIEVGFTIYLGIIFFKLSITNKYLTILLIIINLLYLATFMSTYIFIQFIFAFSLGLIVYRFSFWGMFLLFGLMLISFYAYNPLKTKMRTHNLIISEQSNFISRLKVLSDSLIYLAGNDKQRKNLEYKYHKHFVLSVSAQANYLIVFKDTHNKHYKMIDDQMIKFIRNYSNDKEDLKNLLNDLQKLDLKINEDHVRIKNALIVPKSVIKKHFLNFDSNSYRFFTILNRVDVVSVQRFLVKEYEKGYTGNTFQNLAYLFIPRLLWYDKPIIKNYGVELHNNFYNLNNRNEQNSALGPSFNAEAYWNFGLLGVLGISTFYGLILGLLNNFYNSCNHINAYLSFLLIFIPSIKWIMFFEGWIALTLVGEIIIILIIYLISRLIFAIHKQFFKRCKEN